MYIFFIQLVGIKHSNRCKNNAITFSYYYQPFGVEAVLFFVRTVTFELQNTDWQARTDLSFGILTLFGKSMFLIFCKMQYEPYLTTYGSFFLGSYEKFLCGTQPYE